MADKSTEEILRKYITSDDLTRFKWRILKYMCDMIGSTIHSLKRCYFTEPTLNSTSIRN